jgi:outer membrane cobalamin receptor
VPTTWDVGSQDVQGEASAVYIPADGVSIIAGADLLWSKITFGALKFRSTGEVRSGEREIVERFRNAGLYAQADIKVPYFNVVPAIRADYHTAFGWMISPKLGASSRLLDHLTLRASYGNAFRAPSTLELYSDMIVGTYKIKGNPDLLAENVRAFDCGFEMDFFKGITVQSNFFYNKMENLITIDFDEKVINNIVGNGNLDDARSFGVENEITWNPLRSFKCSFNYTFTESENLRYREPLDYIPRHKGNVTVMWTDTLGPGVLRFSALEGFAGRRHYADWEVMPNIKSKRIDTTVVAIITPQFASLEHYFLTNISCSYTLRNNHEIALEIQNLFDADIEQSGGTLLPGRLASIKYTVPINF